MIEGYAAQLRQSPGQERSALQIGTIDGPRGTGAGIAVRRTETEHDDGGREWEGHEVSQENGCGLQERGTTTIRRMVPPHRTDGEVSSGEGSGASRWSATSQKPD